MPRTRFCAGLICLGALAACELGPSQQIQVISASEAGISVLAEFNSPDVRQVVVSHCEKFGKAPVIRGARPAGDTVLTGWATGSKPYVFEYDCQ
jgi:hypothetical protein